MKDSTKKWLTITGGLVICAILVFVIAQQFTKEKATDALPPTSSSQQDEVVVDPDSSNPTTDPDASSDISEDDLTINPQTSPNDTGTNAGNGAISSGTEQTIQADPEVPEKPDEETLTAKNLTALRSREPLLLRTTTTTSRPSSRPPILGVGCPVSRMSPTPVGTRAEQSTAMAISTNRSAQWADPINMAEKHSFGCAFLLPERRQNETNYQCPAVVCHHVDCPLCTGICRRWNRWIWQYRRWRREHGQCNEPWQLESRQ